MEGFPGLVAFKVVTEREELQYFSNAEAISTLYDRQLQDNFAKLGLSFDLWRYDPEGSYVSMWSVESDVSPLHGRAAELSPITDVDN